MEELPKIDPKDIPDIHSEEFKQMSINNILKINEHIDNVAKMAALMRAVPSVDQLTPQAWRLILEYGESLDMVIPFFKMTMKASASFIDDHEATEVIGKKVLKEHGYDQEG